MNFRTQKSKLIFASEKVSLCFQKMICWVASNHKIVSLSVTVALYDFNQILGSQHELIKISQNQKLYLIILQKKVQKGRWVRDYEDDEYYLV